jgi:hypothetical protein
LKKASGLRICEASADETEHLPGFRVGIAGLAATVVGVSLNRKTGNSRQDVCGEKHGWPIVATQPLKIRVKAEAAPLRIGAPEQARDRARA